MHQSAQYTLEEHLAVSRLGLYKRVCALCESACTALAWSAEVCLVLMVLQTTTSLIDHSLVHRVRMLCNLMSASC